jgi:hypothetical protein
MGNDHKMVQISSHVTSLAGWVGVVGLCSCGWVGSGEDANTKLAVGDLMAAWRKEHEMKDAIESRGTIDSERRE